MRCLPQLERPEAHVSDIIQQPDGPAGNPWFQEPSSDKNGFKLNGEYTLLRGVLSSGLKSPRQNGWIIAAL